MPAFSFCSAWRLMLLALACSLVNAQESKRTAFVKVRVTDVSGATSTGANANFVERSSRETKVRVIDASGSASFELDPGDYELTVTKSGFRSLKMRVELRAGESRQFDVVLQAQDCPPGSCGDVDPPSYEPERAELQGLEIKNVKLFAWELSNNSRKYTEVQAFQETQKLHLLPSDKFDVTCDVIGGSDVLAGDYFLWTTVDFLVAPVMRAYEQMDDNELGSSVGWGQVLEMHDLKAIPIYFLRPSEARQLVVKDLDLSPVLAAFPVGDAGELWPWLIRVRVHVQDRSGKQMAVAERTLRLRPSGARRVSRYNDPIPDRRM